MREVINLIASGITVPLSTEEADERISINESFRLSLHFAFTDNGRAVHSTTLDFSVYVSIQVGPEDCHNRPINICLESVRVTQKISKLSYGAHCFQLDILAVPTVLDQAMQELKEIGRML